MQQNNETNNLMSKGKLQKFAEMETFKNVFQYPFSVIDNVPFTMRGHWREKYFRNQNPVVLELGCGKGEYTVGLARLFPNVNFVGIDIKGSRMYTGAKQALDESLGNVAFLRTNVEIIDRFFGLGEVQEIWLTFSDPQMKNVHKRLTSTFFMERYRRFLCDQGLIYLKTDSNFLYTYTTEMLKANRMPIIYQTDDLYHHAFKKETEEYVVEAGVAPFIQTYYEAMWIERGLNIKYVKFCLPRDGKLEEPDVEIELDDYRSYHRPKRSSLMTSK